MMLRGFAMALTVMALFGATPGTAQQQGTTTPVPPVRGSINTPVLIIDSERAYRESAFGLRVAAEIEEQGALLNIENTRIQAELEAEEKRLTELRSTMEPEPFRQLADAFDQKVQRTRREQDGKLRALNAKSEQGYEEFLFAAVPVLEQLMREAGAPVILEKRLVFISLSAVDITDEAVARLNETVGTGGSDAKP